MSEIPAEKKLNLRDLFSGLSLVLLSNLIYVGNSYIVAWTGLRAPEIALVKGAIQTTVFAILVWKHRTSSKQTDVTGEKSNEKAGKFSLQVVALLSVYGFIVSTVSFAFIAAVSMMPIGDLIVVSFTSPVFSVFLDRIILKRRLTYLSVLLSIFIIVGSFLVIQPPIIFGSLGPTSNITDFSTLPLPLDVLKIEATDINKRGDSYYIGVAISIYVAVFGALSNVIATKCRNMDISTSFLMLVSGVFTCFISLISLPICENRLITSPSSFSLQAALLLPISSMLTMVAYWTIILALNLLKNPTLVSMLRSTEILISLVTESFWWHQLPGPLSLSGSLLVSVCVLTMAGHDKVIASVDRILGKGRPGERNKEELK